MLHPVKLAAFIIALSLTQAAPNPLGSIEQRATGCFSAYPSQRTDTGATRTKSLFLSVFANAPALDNRVVQLRQDGPRRMIAVIDDDSPVLAFQLWKGVIYSQHDVTPAQNLGPVGGLRNLSMTADGGGRQAFIFRNDTADAGAAFKNSVDKWTLFSFGEGQYGLYSNTVTNGFANGFMACKVNDYYQLFYNEYKTDPPEDPACEYIGLQTVVAPVLN